MPRLMPARAGSRCLLAISTICAALLAFATLAPNAHAARGLDRGFYEPDYTSGDIATRTNAFDRTVQAGAGWALIYITWSGVAPPTKPPGFDATNPDDPSYNWDAIDAAVRDASARGLRIVLAITKAPAWAEGPGRPSESDAPPGTWKPNASDLGDFTRAAARRYDGQGGLPAVRYWQLWAEPNLGVNLSPQFQGDTPVGYEVYRPMLNAFYSNLKAVSSQNMVITGGTAPYGGLTPSRGLTYQRMQPLTFWRGLLCLNSTASKKKKKKKGKGKKSGTALTPVPCPNPAHFDIAAHHPINVGAPTRHALNADDASTPDIGKVRRIINAAARTGGLLPGGPKPIWATEIWWNSNPPSRGVSLQTQARYLQQSFYLLWKQHVSNVFWFEVRDALQDGHNPIPTCGVFFRDGSPKPSLRAFQFPFVTERLSKTRVRAWGIAPAAGKVAIGTGKGKRFHRIKTLKAGANRVFVGSLRLRGRARLKARQGSQTSLTWRQS